MNYIKKLLLLMSLLPLLIANSAFAWKLDHFRVTLKPNTQATNANIWDAIDITIEAMDKNDATVTDYVWDVLVFSESDPDAEFPKELKENSYKFLKSDQWKRKFENGIKFKKSWKQTVQVYDLNDDTIIWSSEIQINDNWWDTSSSDISILTPENWLTTWENKIKISWQTKKNYQVRIMKNDKGEWKVMSNDIWIFEKEVLNLVDWENVFYAQVLDADDKVIWESSKVKIKVINWGAKVKSLKITPNKDVAPESKLSAELISISWLKEVSLVINDVVTKLPEKSDWKYIWFVNAPKEAWDYKVDSILTDDLWHRTEELWVESISVALPAWWPDPKIDTWSSLVPKNLRITWLRLVELKTKSILTWDKVNDAYKYNVYKKLADWTLEFIVSVTQPKFEVNIDETKKQKTYANFAVKAVAKNEKSEDEEWDLSEATKIQTWPELYILFLLSILIWWAVIYKNTYYKWKSV